VGYDIENLTDPERRKAYGGEVVKDPYGRLIPKHAHGTANLGTFSSSTKQILQTMTQLYDKIINPDLLVRRLTVVAAHVQAASLHRDEPEQLDMFTDTEAQQQELQREKKMQRAVLEIKRKYGKNAILRGMNLEEGATAKDRNRQIGGHKA
jgi:DNA polymerase V